MRQLYFFACFSMLFLLPFSAKAWHIVGGELSYTCLGNDQYEIKLTIFRDCGQTVGAPFDNPATIGFFDSENQLVNFIQVPLGVQDDTLNPTLQSQCFTNPPNVCVHTTTYEAVVNLPFLPGGYQIVYQRCCRNQTITNIVAPNTQGATYSIHLTEEAMQECNSSPKFNNWPPLYICAFYPFSIDQSATDAEGDSLVYRLCQPFQGADQTVPQPIPPNDPPYQPVTWVDPPYNIDNMLNGIAGGEVMKIDPVTGLLTGTPTTIGQFVIGICVEEYRNGELISVTRRDYQLNVGECGFPTSAFFAPEKLCETYTVGFDNNSLNAQDYLWFFGDPANPGASSTLPNPTYTYSDTGTFLITLIAEPGTVCADTTTKEVQIILNSLFANFNIDYADCADSLTVQIIDSTVDTASMVSNWQWILDAPQG
ncbi:MAG: PKD domain-containing protein, partial [Bacteroidota bacterium]